MARVLADCFTSDRERLAAQAGCGGAVAGVRFHSPSFRWRGRDRVRGATAAWVIAHDVRGHEPSVNRGRRTPLAR